MCSSATSIPDRQTCRRLSSRLQLRVDSSLRSLDKAKDWAIITASIPKSYEQLVLHVRCQSGYYSDPQKSISLFHQCAHKGMEDGFAYWYSVVRNPIELENKRKALRQDREVDKIVKKIWKAMLQVQSEMMIIYVNGRKVVIPPRRTLPAPQPEGILVERHVVFYPQTHNKMGTKKQTTPELAVKEKLYNDYIDRLQSSNPSIYSQIAEDAEVRCEYNRMYTLHNSMKKQLDSCVGVMEFQQRSVSILQNGSCTIEEIEYLDRVLFDITWACGIVDHSLSTSPPADSPIQAPAPQRANIDLRGRLGGDSQLLL